jgi:hypothetical protein
MDKGAEAPRTADCPTNASTLAISVTPDPLARGDAIDVEISWSVDLQLTAPVVATLSAGDGPVVEVDVPLLLDSGSYPYDYVGSVLNPFGVGAPAGTLEVLTRAGVASGCDLIPTAATAITLE